MRQLSILLICLLCSSLYGQTFQNGFKFYLPSYDTTKQVFLPDFPVDTIGPKDFVTVNSSGDFEVKGKLYRIYGNNIWDEPCLYPEKDKAPLIAARLRKFGFNFIRLGNEFNNGWGLRLDNGSTLAYNTDRLDKFFFFINELKKQGIRIVLSWNGEIRHTAKEGIVDCDSIAISHTLCDYYDPSLINVRKAYIKDLLTKVNPYTGLALKDDPVLGLLEIVNEDWFFLSFLGNSLKPIHNGGELTTYYSHELDSLWNQYLLKKYGTDQSLSQAWHYGSYALGNMLDDSSFESTNPGQYWSLMVLDTAKADVAYTTGGINGNNCAKINITTSTGTDWHVQFFQKGFTVMKDTTYQVKFWAKADKNCSIVASLAKFGAPYTNYGNTSVNLTTSWTEYSFVATPGETNSDDAYLSFSLGTNAGAVYLDNVSLDKFSQTDLQAGESLTKLNIKRYQKDELGQFKGRRKLDEVAFYIDLQEKYFDEFHNFLRDECGLKIPVAGQNFLMGIPDNKIQSRLDYIDNHAYWQLPLEDTTGALAYHNVPMVKDPDGSITKQIFRGVAFKGKPLTTSECNHPYFTDYYLESQFFMTAYSSLHDAAAIMYFSYGSAQPMDSDYIENNLDFSRNNLQMAFAPSFAKAFRDKLISTANQTIEVKMNNDDVLASPFTRNEWQIYPSGFPGLQALNHRVVVSDYNSTTSLKDNSIPADSGNPYISDTKELVWDKDGLFTINTPKFIAGIGFLQNYPNKEIGNLKLVSGNTFGGFSWISLTSDSLVKAARSLLTIGTRQENTGTVWNSDKTRVISIGKSPTWHQPAQISFDLTIQADSIRVHQLGTLGQRTGKFTVYHPTAPKTFRVNIDQTVTPTLWFGIETQWNNDTIRSLSLLKPKGENPVMADSVYTIKWEQMNVHHLTVKLSVDSGKVWSTVAIHVDANLNEYKWKVPGVEYDHCLIKIISEEDSLVNSSTDVVFPIYSVIPDNLIKNGNFSLGMNNWNFFVNSGSASASEIVKNRVLNVSYQSGGSVEWYVQLLQSGIPLIKGKQYDLSFDASAEQQRTVSAGLGQDGGNYTCYFEQKATLTNTLQNYTYSFVMNNATDSLARFYLNLGNSSTGLKVDNIILREHSAQTSLSVSAPAVKEAVTAGKKYVIRWDAYNISNVNIYYKFSGQTDWTSIINQLTANAGQYEWTIPSSQQDSCKIKVECAENPSIVAYSGSFYVQYATGVKNMDGVLFTSLSQNHPNPFSWATRIPYTVSNFMHVNISVYNLAGEKVSIITDEDKPAGTYEVIWTANDVPAGIYFYRMETPDYVGTKKLLIVR